MFIKPYGETCCFYVLYIYNVCWCLTESSLFAFSVFCGRSLRNTKLQFYLIDRFYVLVRAASIRWFLPQPGKIRKTNVYPYKPHHTVYKEGLSKVSITWTSNVMKQMTISKHLFQTMDIWRFLNYCFKCSYELLKII